MQFFFSQLSFLATCADDAAVHFLETLQYGLLSRNSPPHLYSALLLFGILYPRCGLMRHVGVNNKIWCSHSLARNVLNMFQESQIQSVKKNLSVPSNINCKECLFFAYKHGQCVSKASVTATSENSWKRISREVTKPPRLLTYCWSVIIDKCSCHI